MLSKQEILENLLESDSNYLDYAENDRHHDICLEVMAFCAARVVDALDVGSDIQVDRAFANLRRAVALSDMYRMPRQV